MQVLGGVLAGLATVTALLARLIGFELDVFYVAIGVAGAGLFAFGAQQRNRQDRAYFQKGKG